MPPFTLFASKHTGPAGRATPPFRRLALLGPLLGLLLGTALSGCGGGVMAVNYIASQSELKASANLSDTDLADLRDGRLTALRERYDHVPADRLSDGQLSLLCDVRLKLQDFGRAQLCNETLAVRAARNGDAALIGKVRGRRALFALAQQRYGDAVAELEGNQNEGARYVRALAQARLGKTAETRDAAALLGRQFKPRPVFYAASLYAAAGDCGQSLRLLEDPERRLLADYGLTALSAGASASPSGGASANPSGGANANPSGGASANKAPFRLDVFDDFSYGWFGDFSFAPAANVYVEMLAAQCMAETGRTAMAVDRLNRLLAFPDLPAYRDVHWAAMYRLGRLRQQAGDRDGALSLFRSAAEVVEQSRATILSEDGRIAFALDKQQLYGDLVDGLLRQGRQEQALEVVERAKSRVLVDMLSSRRDFAPDDLPVGEARQLLAQLDEAQASFSTIALRGDGGAAGGGTDAALSAIRAANGRIRSRSPSLAPLVSAVPFRFAELTAVLQPGEAGVVYYNVGDHWYAFVLSSGTARTVDLGTPPVRTLVLQFLKQLSDPASTGYSAAARALGDAVLTPVLAGASGQKLLIVPHGPLHYVPFAAIDGAGGPLVAQRAIRMAPSLSALVATRSRPGMTAGAADRRGAIFGNPARREAGLNLPGAEAEAQAIAHIYPKSDLFLRGQATLDQFRSAAQGKAFVHIAAHGLFQPADPLASRLLFSPSGDNSGDLTVGDLYGMRLDSSLAVLSACQTGLSDVSPGDDLIGLVRGFMFSGVGGVVATYWNVADESTALLMQTFYSRLKSGASAQEALQAGQTAVRQRFPHPFYWAPFALMGGDARL
ncbi:CHAT domain-containing protein (plasmid) [Azospirillum oryzae]|uniref:CHAT domain-containing protein n=1 Tax=Azospirillum oryzae TaxID=286727 RepID=A0A6N1AC89_9PROT|nr:CHAT domain-containing protein [Azospirillum oryzae]KAA0586702.1 CHAT domain-containing protein [Azospirillum oryzae]QKS49146.1 CHAT domain-containing protein [Azospirillum oryzae]GLR81957.1 hypothetical protein GCM10007856_46480 [Azospirillum oryzae]